MDYQFFKDSRAVIYWLRVRDRNAEVAGSSPAKLTIKKTISAEGNGKPSSENSLHLKKLGALPMVSVKVGTKHAVHSYHIFQPFERESLHIIIQLRRKTFREFQLRSLS